MKTDTLFYRLFLQRPELIFDLTAWAKPERCDYRFASVELKQAAFRIDGVFIPADDQDAPLIFAEVQYRKDPKIYARLLSEALLYLYQQAPRQDWRAVAIFPDRGSDPGQPRHYREFFQSGRIQPVYLDGLPKRGEGVGVLLIELLEIGEPKVAAQLKRIKTALSSLPETSQHEWLELLETILVYKLPRWSRDEVRAMLGDILNTDLKQTRFYQDVFMEGRLEGKLEGKLEGEAAMLLRLLAKRFGAIPESARQRVRQADAETLLLWSERVLSCNSLDEVLGE